MKELIACCGLDCEKCEARTATLRDDDALRAKVAKEWSELNSADIRPEMINCTGCRTDGIRSVYCESLCPIRKCVTDRDYVTCGECHEMKSCGVLAAITADNEEAVRNLQGGIRIRSFCVNDAEAVSALIIRTMRTSNIKDYTAELVEEWVKIQQPGNVLERAGWTHFYVAEDGEEIIGCGAIGPYWGKTDESSLYTIFVLPEYQGSGIGRLIIEALEQDEFFLRARRIEIPSSITGVSFYRHMGYDYKNGVTEPDDEHLIRLEKFR